MQKIFGDQKKFIDIRMNDIYALSAEQKANLAYQLAVLAPINGGENQLLERQKLQDKVAFVAKQTPQEIANIKKIFGTRTSDMVNIYTSFFNTQQKVVPLKESFTDNKIDSPEEQKEPGIRKPNYKKFAFEFKPTK